MQPSVIPGKANDRLVRRSRLLFHWRASDLSLTPVTGETPTFVRATGGGMVADANGNLHDFAQAQPRFEMVDLDGDGVRETPGLLLEGQRTNLCLRSEDLDGAGWTIGGAGTLVIADAFWAKGSLSLSRLSTLLGNTLYRAVTLAGGTEAVSIFVRGDGAAAAFDVKLTDSGAANRLVCAVTISAAQVVTATASTGSVLAVTALGDGVYRVLCTAPSCAAGAGTVTAFSATSGTSVILGGGQVEDAAFPSSYIKTPVGGTVTRNGEELTFPRTFGVQSLTVYAKFARPLWTSVATGNSGLISISSADLFSSVFTIQRTGTDLLAVSSGVQALIAIPAGNPLEVLGQVKDQATGPKVALDVGSGLSSFSAAGTPFSAWGDATIFVGDNGAAAGNELFAGLIELKIASGLRTMAQLKEMF